ncbi:PREDICTED: uncharacterized protein KIAA1614 homolog [Ficedula albicollis]|uniref:uncharacterized protein KIAA1614 homolog n=1 Tax=Ficedula albicollis TaxID=59894 RepID=UPI0007AD9623|nr:PREDICTED: uncharacterized protein KIAA1614 homolog [Ficedula albicollis]
MKPITNIKSHSLKRQPERGRDSPGPSEPRCPRGRQPWHLQKVSVPSGSSCWVPLGAWNRVGGHPLWGTTDPAVLPHRSCCPVMLAECRCSGGPRLTERSPPAEGSLPGFVPPWRSASLHQRPSLDDERRTPLRDWGRPSVSPPAAESWERLSLAERVERNRRLLQEVLGLAAPGVCFGKVVALSGQLGEVGGKTFGVMGVLRASLQSPALRVQLPVASHPWAVPSPSPGCRRCSRDALGDTSQSSLVSRGWGLPSIQANAFPCPAFQRCQRAMGTGTRGFHCRTLRAAGRAFVGGQELELSPRHEQAKQLLQRARMKARTNPLRASHDILLLPAGPQPREASGRPSVAPRDGGGLGSALPSPEPAGSRQPGDGAGQPKARSGDLVAGGKCSACGSLLGAAAGRGTDTQAAPDVAKSSPAAQRSVPGDSRGLSAAQTEPKIRPLGPGGSPLWILPSRQRIHTEKIKETYIGDVTYIDEVDSALESTDTSDGCRTDSEEAGPRSPHLRGHRDPRARGHRAPRAALQPEARARKGICVASGGPEDGDSGPGPVCPPEPGRTSSREDGESHRHLGDSKGVGNRAHPLQQPSEPLQPSSQLRTSTPIPGTHVPAPPPTKKACAQVPCRKALCSSSSHQASSQRVRGPQPDAGSGTPPPPGGTAGPAERRGPCSPRWLPGSPLRALSTNNCNNTHGQNAPGTGRGSLSHPAAGPVTPVPSEAAHPAGEGAGMPGAQPQQHPAGSTAHGEPGRPVSRKGSSASASGLKKLLCSLSQSTKQRLGRFRCYSMEQLPAPGGSPPGGPAIKKSPSLQSLQLVSPFCQPQKAASIQSLHPQLGKARRASAYLLPQTTADRKGGSGPQRSLSVEDIGAPGQLRAVGRVVEVFPDGTSQLELQRPPHGAFGFSVTSGHGRPDTGVYVQEMADAGTAKLYAGLLGVGDEILQVNGAAVSGLGLARIRQLLLRADSLSLRVLRHRPAPR